MYIYSIASSIARSYSLSALQVLPSPSPAAGQSRLIAASLAVLSGRLLLHPLDFSSAS